MTSISSSPWSKNLPVLLHTPALTEQRILLDQTLPVPKRAKLASVSAELKNRALQIAQVATKLDPQLLHPHITLSASTSPSTAFMNDVEAITVEISGTVRYCHSCEELTTRLNDMEVVLKELTKKDEARHNLALIRQLALNLEHLLKIECLVHIPEFAKADFFSEDGVTLCEFSIVSKSLMDMFNLVPNHLRTCVRNGKAKALMVQLRKMKRDFSDTAHPTRTLDGKDLTYEDCKALVNETDSLNEDQKALILQEVEVLRSVRAASGQSNMLVDL
jgi:hypothetical protein